MDRNTTTVGTAPAAPQALLSVPDGVMLVVGMVIGAGIFKAPSIVAGNVSNGLEFLLAWVVGGVITLCGALVYAELSGRFPETGGEYRFLSRGYGPGTAFVFAWSRMTVIQTGAIAAVAYVFGDYAQQIVPLGARGAAVYAGLGVVVMTALNLAGTPQSKTLQKLMGFLLVAALAAVALVGLLGPSAAASVAKPVAGDLGLAMIFVLLTYGGWNEAAYIAGEVRNPQRNMIRILIGGIALISALYLVVNLAYLASLGLGGMRESKAVAADLMRPLAGDAGAAMIALVVCLATLTTMNAAILTGARSIYAFGRDFPMFASLGAWRASGSTPANALLVQGAVSLVLVLAGSFAPDGFSAMVAYTAPVFWTFFLLCGIAVFLFRMRDGMPSSFRTPLYPLTPLVFTAACAYMLYSSVNYVRFAVPFGYGVLAGLVVMVIGIPLYLAARARG
ncbi:MAG TPA: amino acid permease [Burkholderiales bacterium]|nr:amino acid permease [Burkholderiales bacterium]